MDKAYVAHHSILGTFSLSARPDSFIQSFLEFFLHSFLAFDQHGHITPHISSHPQVLVKVDALEPALDVHHFSQQNAQMCRGKQHEMVVLRPCQGGGSVGQRIALAGRLLAFDVGR